MDPPDKAMVKALRARMAATLAGTIIDFCRCFASESFDGATMREAVVVIIMCVRACVLRVYGIQYCMFRDTK